MYSQNEEEKYILEYFSIGKNFFMHPGKMPAFLDIGANDGITLSNTRALFDTGNWNGVFVEPSPEAFKKLKENYRAVGGSYFYNFALGNHNGEIDFYDSGTHLNKEDTGLLSTASEEDYNKWRGSTQFTPIKVQCFRYKTFLNRVKIKEFDFISLDAEGFDLDILKQIDIRPTSCVCVEWNSKEELKKEFDKLMIGFKIIYTSCENLIYAR